MASTAVDKLVTAQANGRCTVGIGRITPARARGATRTCKKGLSTEAMPLCVGPAEIGWTERRYGGARVHGVHACNQHQSVGNKSRQSLPALKSRQPHAGCALWRPHTPSVKGHAPRPAGHLYYSSLHRRSGQRIADWAQRSDGHENVTCLALARGSICSAEKSEIPLGGRRTCPTRSLAERILVEIAEAVTAEAAKLGRLGLEIACTHGSESAYNSVS
jgi:hypothetical protein